MTGQPPPLVQKFLDKLSRSRDLSISIIVHVILVAIFGSAILFKVVEDKNKDGFTTPPGMRLTAQDKVPEPPKPDLASQAVDPTFSPLSNPTGLQPITTVDPLRTAEYSIRLPTVPVVSKTVGAEVPVAAPVTKVDANALSTEDAKAIQKFTEDWRLAGNGSREPEFQFTAYLGQYQGGNWNSTVRISQGKIEAGSLPNLLYLMSQWTKDRVRTNYQNVQAIRLDSDELFTKKPPFIFLTGTRDFSLTDKEVENLRNYLRLGGCVWGDSSVPGQNSRFDIAFKREMRRVVGGDEDFAALPVGHPLFSKAYFPGVKSVPAGLNSYQLPVTVLKMHGEIAVIYTANDYGDMWQIGLDSSGKIDLSRNASGQCIAVNETLYAHRDVYIRNISQESVEASFKFGANVVMHLLTRWENRVGTRSAL